MNSNSVYAAITRRTIRRVLKAEKGDKKRSSDVHIRWQRGKEPCVSVSQRAEFTLDSLQKADLFGSPRQTFAQDFRLSLCLFLSLIIFPSFHTRVRWAPMKEPNSWSTEHLLFLLEENKEECNNGGSCLCSVRLRESPYAALFFLQRAVSIRKTYIFIHSECLFLKWGSSVPHAHSMCRFPHGAETWQLFVCVKDWSKRGFFMVWVHCESSFTSSSTLLQMN